MAEQQTFNLLVVGSTPTRPTTTTEVFTFRWGLFSRLGLSRPT